VEYRKINKDELDIILSDHKAWLADYTQGKRADLSYANLRSANLSYADLSSADLRYANLSYANLSSTNLHYADLSYANLRSADLRSTNLHYANLHSANLHSTNLLIFQFNRHTAYFTKDGTLRIGCHIMPVSEWILGYEEIGEKSGYTKLEINVYGDFIKSCLRLFEEWNKGK